MSTKKSLKHLKSLDEFLIANVSNYFENHPRRDSSSYIQHTFQATGVRRRTVFRVRKELRETGTLSSRQRSKWGQYKPVDALDEVVIGNNVQEFYIHHHQLPTINNLLSVLKTDIMSTIHQNSTRNNMIITQKVGLYKFKNDAKNNYTQWESNPPNPEHELIVLPLHHCLIVRSPC